MSLRALIVNRDRRETQFAARGTIKLSPEYTRVMAVKRKSKLNEAFTRDFR